MNIGAQSKINVLFYQYYKTAWNMQAQNHTGTQSFFFRIHFSKYKLKTNQYIIQKVHNWHGLALICISQIPFYM